ncbi:MAG: phosphate/phosphite/phosphonate ABC transporter substrate-binding protein [Gammaproteobacteria bacterium]|nr:MAG: phosphate/phosphite/phosphonate ABC transporter substrate-binding protein [Gammaproteobacteria bacterium]
MANQVIRRFAVSPIRRFVIGMVLAVSAMAPTQAEPLTLTFGIVPQQSASKLARLWTPILDYLGEQTGYRLHFRTAQDIPAFERRLAAGEYDLSYMNPYHYTTFHRAPGYEAFARAKDKRIKGIIVVRKDSPVKDLREFSGQILAFPSPAAFAASVLPRAWFNTEGIPITPKYVSSHDSVYRTVARGLYPAGGGVMRTFNNVDPAISDQLRILWTTRPYTPHAIAAHPRVPNKVVQRLQQAMLAMDRDPQGKKLLAAIRIKGFERGEDGDWDDVRALGIDLLDKLVKQPITRQALYIQ